jgi:hypothetical protein
MTFLAQNFDFEFCESLFSDNQEPVPNALAVHSTPFLFFI